LPVYLAAVTDIFRLFSHELHNLYLILREQAKAYRKQVHLLNEERMKKEKKSRSGDSVEMNKF